jgi:hypothetical protein
MDGHRGDHDDPALAVTLPDLLETVTTKKHPSQVT